MKKQNSSDWSKTDERIVVIGVIVFIGLLIVLGINDKYRDYHAKMHSVPVWGRIVAVDVQAIARQSSNNCKYEYVVDGEVYYHFYRNLPKQFVNDSVIVFYDTTNHKRAFPLCQNPEDMKTAFFKSKKDYMPLRWQQDYDRCVAELEKMREDHRARKHFYDRFCRDDF